MIIKRISASKCSCATKQTVLSQDDIRQRVHLNTFGFYKDGYMSMSMNSLSFTNGKMDNIDSSTVRLSSFC